MAAYEGTALLLTGFAGSGKDAMAAGLGPRWTRFALADILKDLATDIVRDAYSLDVPDGFFHDRAIKEEPIVGRMSDGDGMGTWDIKGKTVTPRWLLQWLGTDICRKHLGPDVWINALANKITSGLRPPNIVITDVRFPNEATTLPRLLADLGYSVRVVRVVDPDAPAVDVSTLHASEAGIPLLPVDDEFKNARTPGVSAAASLGMSRARFNSTYACGAALIPTLSSRGATR